MTQIERIRQAWGITAPAGVDTSTSPAAPPRTAEGEVLRQMLGGDALKVTAENRRRWDDFESYAYADDSFNPYRNERLTELSDLRRRIVLAFQSGLDQGQICTTVSIPSRADTEYRCGCEELFPSPEYVKQVVESWQARFSR
jgi:hypothetical protein